MTYCKKHPRTKLIQEESFGCEYCGDTPELYCPQCERIETREHNKFLREKCNIVVDTKTVLIKNKKILRKLSEHIAYLSLPHNGKKLNKGSYAKLENGYLKYSKIPAQFFVVQ